MGQGGSTLIGRNWRCTRPEGVVGSRRGRGGNKTTPAVAHSQTRRLHNRLNPPGPLSTTEEAVAVLSYHERITGVDLLVALQRAGASADQIAEVLESRKPKKAATTQATGSSLSGSSSRSSGALVNLGAMSLNELIETARRVAGRTPARATGESDRDYADYLRSWLRSNS